MDPSTLNELAIQGESFLLVEGAQVVHLAAADGSQESLSAVDPERLDDALTTPGSSASRYRRSQLVDRRWSSRALCGRNWSLMAATELGPIILWQEPAYAPTCRACLRALDRRFPAVEPDERLDLIVDLVVRAVRAYGCAAIDDVPGPQVEPLRRALRAGLRAAGFRSQTTCVQGTVFVVSDDAYEAIDPAVRRERDVAAATAIEGLLSGEARKPVDSSEWRFRWSTWAGNGSA